MPRAVAYELGVIKFNFQRGSSRFDFYKEGRQIKLSCIKFDSTFLTIIKACADSQYFINN